MSVINLNEINVDNDSSICKDKELIYIRMQQYKSSSTSVTYMRMADTELDSDRQHRTGIGFSNLSFCMLCQKTRSL